MTQTLIIDSEAKRDRAAKIVSQLPYEPPLLLTVDKFRARRTLTQNARYWALLQKVAEHTGHSSDEIHEVALCRFHGYEEHKIGGITRQVPTERSSTKDTKAFAQYMEATEAWIIQEFGVFLE